MLSGCKQAAEPSSSDVYVKFEIESAFQDDSVKLDLDEETLLQSRVTTDYSVNLAWSSGLQKLTRESHTLHFEISEYDVKMDFVIAMSNDTSSVLIRFDKSTGQIRIDQIKGTILRD